MEPATPPIRVDRIHGVDFSGARDAGRTIWIATGVPAGDGLKIIEVTRGEDLPKSGRSRAESLAALCRFIQERPGSVFGCDFPFGLPRPLSGDQSWEELVLAFAERYPSADAFRAVCREQTGGRELRRVTDVRAKTPFAAYNLRIYRQTFHGIRDVLAPLTRQSAVRVFPMHRYSADRDTGMSIVVEVCPASTLKREGQYRPYKGRSAELRAAREGILAHFEAQEVIEIDSPRTRERVIGDVGGDALDSVIAVVASHRTMRAGFPIEEVDRPLAAVEGWVWD